MTVREQVLAAKTPRDALLVLADAIDRIDHHIKGPYDEWSEWDDPETHLEVNKELSVNPKDALVQYAAVKAQLDEATDGDDRRALEAKLRLLKDELRAKPHQVDMEQQASKLTTDEGGKVIVDLPVPTEEHMEQRREFGEKCLKIKDEFGPEVLEAYVKGGPLVLYYTDRDFVMRMPNDFKRVMVEDVCQFSPREGHQMAADVLKDVTADGGREVTMEVLSRGR